MRQRFKPFVIAGFANCLIAALLFCSSETSSLWAQDQSPDTPLPMWIDPEREASVYDESEYPQLSDPELFAAPPQNFRVPAEYEPIQSVVIGSVGYTGMLNKIQSAVELDGAANVLSITGYGRATNINCPLDTAWMRDYGPVGIVENANGTRQSAVMDTIYRHWRYRVNDDKAPNCLARETGMQSYAVPLVLDGGNFLIDSARNLFMTRRTYNWNSDKSAATVDQLLKEHFNLKSIHALDYAGYPGAPTDGTGHIDMFVKLLSDDTVMIAQTSAEPFRSVSEKAVQLFSSLKAPNGKSYKIVRTKGWYSNGTWYTYTNSLIVNNLVLMPSYNSIEANNQQAKTVYETAMPGVKVTAINSDASIVDGGAIHCLTQTIPKSR